MLLHYDRDWYPVKHRFKNKDIGPDEVGKCFAKTDWKTEQKFKSFHINRLTQMSHIEDNKFAGKTFALTDDLEMVCTRKKIKNRTYDIKEYANDVLEMFDSHMTSVVEQYKGRYVVLSSGGVDGNMIAAWLYKNKLDFEMIGFVNGPRHGAFNSMRVNKSSSNWKKLVPVTILDLDGDNLIKHYVLDDGISSVPKTAMNHLDGYDYLTNQQCQQHGDWILHGAGSNHTMLHNGKSIMCAYNSLDKSWKSFKHTDVLANMKYPGVFRTKYNKWLLGDPLNRYMLDDWLNQDIRWKDHGAWTSYSRVYDSRDDKVLNLSNENWSELWESIDWTNLDFELVERLLGANIWLEYIGKYTNQDIESETRTGHTGTGLFRINDENYRICSKLLEDLKHRLHGNIRLIGEVMASQWLLKRYRVLPVQSLMLCQMESFLQR